MGVTGRAGRDGKPGAIALLRTAMSGRKTAVMLALGFSSGLPVALLVGTLNAWLGAAKVSLATIGILSWIGLAYAFKFLWSPLVDRVAPPVTARLGRRKAWLIPCQIVVAGVLLALAATDPTTAIGTFAVIAVVGALASATQDIAVDAWRIDVADEQATVELLSALYQLGFRLSALFGGAFSLVLAARLGWPGVYVVMGVVMVLLALVTLSAPEGVERVSAPELAPVVGEDDEHRRARLVALAIVATAWGAAIVLIGGFMAVVLGTPAGVKPPSAVDFTRGYGPLIVAATVIVPMLVGAWTNRRGIPVEPVVARGVVARGYEALVMPFAELMGRLRGGALIVLGLILTYRICDSIWGPFAYPFYLESLHYTNDEVAFASKIFGVVMLLVGVALSGVLFVWLGRMATLLIGAVTAAATNLLYADLALGGGGIDWFAHITGLSALATGMGSDDRMMRLLIAISGENIASGLAGAAFVAYLSTVTSRRFAAIQYALLSSLTLLVGSLGRGALGEAIETIGYAPVFRFTAALGLVAVVFVLLEWWRTAGRAGADAPAV